MQHAPSGGPSLIELQSARVFEDVDHRIGITTESERAPSVCQRAERRNPVAEVTLGRCAGTDRNSLGPQQGDVVVVHMDRVDGGEVRAKNSLAL